MTKRQISALVIGASTVIGVTGWSVYSGLLGTPPDTAGEKPVEPVPPAPVTKATVAGRNLTEREQRLVGRWRLERITPRLLSPNFKATAEYFGDGTWTLQTSEEILGPQVRHGTFRLVGDMHVTQLEGDETSAGLIEELTDDRLVKSFQDGGTHWIMEWSRLK